MIQGAETLGPMPYDVIKPLVFMVFGALFIAVDGKSKLQVAPLQNLMLGFFFIIAGIAILIAKFVPFGVLIG